MRTTLLVFLFVTGCQLPLPCQNGTCDFGADRLKGQDAAEQIVWNDLYGETDEPPQVIWVDQGDCSTTNGPRKGIINPVEGICVMGISYPGIIYTLIRPLQVDTWNGYAHELLHEHFRHLYGDSDHDHLRPEWGPMLAEAQRRMIAAKVY